MVAQIKSPASKHQKSPRTWPYPVTVGRATVRVYRRRRADGSFGFEVANYSDNKRKLESWPNAESAVQRANDLAGLMNSRQVVAASLTNDQASNYTNAAQILQPFNISVVRAAEAVAACLKHIGSLSKLEEAAESYAKRNKEVKSKPVADLVADLLKTKESRGASPRYLQDLRYRLNRFAVDFNKDAGDVTTGEIQTWLDEQELSLQGFKNYRTVLHLFFKFAVARGNAFDNPVEGVEKVKVKAGEITVYTPQEMSRLLSAASPEFLPILLLGGFAGLRSAEIERLTWDAIHLPERHIIVGIKQSKTASRRIVPICENLALWLAPYASHTGNIWPFLHDALYEAMLETASATEVIANPKQPTKHQPAVKWKKNALRHSYASYRFAQLLDAGRLAGELGNSATIVHKHYRELVKPADAVKWFGLVPQSAPNVSTLATAALNAG